MPMPTSLNEAEVTAQLAAHRTPPPPGPPWKIAGPTGTLVVIDTESELKTFVETLAGDPDVNLLNFRSMLGILQREAPPRHVIMWQPLSRLQF